MKPLHRLAMIATAVLVFQVLPPQARQSAQTTLDVSKLGPQVGDSVPDFRLPDQAGHVRTLSSILGPKGAMLVFIRSADW